MGYLANALGDQNDLGFFATPADLTTAYPVGAPGYFALVGTTDTFWLWDTDTGAWVDSFKPGTNAYVYIAYASDDIGTDFTMTFDPLLDYIGIITTDIAIPSPDAADFAGLWKNYKGLSINWKGTYNAGTTYQINDAVYYLGTSYIWINATPGSGQTPADDTYWDILALKGTDGEGSGDVIGPASATNKGVALFDTTTGKLLKNSTSFVQLDNGNVGIGTATPSQKLHVAENINIDGTSAYLYDGHNAIKLATKGDITDYSSTIIGRLAGDTKTDGTTVKQTAVGHLAGYQNSGNYQTALGYAAGYPNTGNYQTALGMSAGQSNTGNNQTALGYAAGYQNSGSYQTALGYAAGYQNSGNYQTALGMSAGQSNTGNYQTALGMSAGQSNTGHRVIGIGYEATMNNTVSDVVAIGYQAGKDNNVANQFIVKQANLNSIPLIQGNFATGNVGIGTTTPGEKLAVNGNITLNTFVAGATVDKRIGLGTITTGALSGHWGGIQFTESANSQELHFWTSIGGTNSSEKLTILGGGNVGIGTTSPTAVLHLKAGTATSGTAPLKLTSGVVNTTPEAGALEWDGTDLFITI